MATNDPHGVLPPEARVEVDETAPAREDDLEVLLANVVPQEFLLENGETVTVQELTFSQTFKFEGAAMPIIRDLHELGTDWRDVELDDITAILGKHHDVLMRMIAAAVGKPLAWVEGLSDGDGIVLLLNFWVVNRGFFIRRLVRRMTVVNAQAIAQEIGSHHGARSSPSSLRAAIKRETSHTTRAGRSPFTTVKH